MNKEELINLLGFEPKNGGSYIFEKESFYRPNWLVGMHISKTRLMFHPKDNWIKIEYMLENNWEKFFEGSVESIKDLKIILKSISYE